MLVASGMGLVGVVAAGVAPLEKFVEHALVVMLVGPVEPLPAPVPVVRPVLLPGLRRVCLVSRRFRMGPLLHSWRRRLAALHGGPTITGGLLRSF